MKTRMKTTRTRTGNSGSIVTPVQNSSRVRRRLLKWLLTSLAGFAALQVFGFQKKEAPYAVVAGTVFQESGFSFPDVNVQLTAKGAGKKQGTSSSFRGEFSFRVPPEPATYVITASKRGFVTSSVEAVVPGEGRVDVTITLAAESKK
jgi:hypothetical protein